MATGVVGTIQGSSSLSYKPSTNAKVVILASNVTSNQSIIVAGVSIQIPANTTLTIGPFWVAAGATLTISTPANLYAIVSALEA